MILQKLGQIRLVIQLHLIMILFMQEVIDMSSAGMWVFGGWMDFNSLRDVRANSSLVYRQEYKPTLSPLDAYEVDINEKTAHLMASERERFVYGKDEKFIQNANWANGAVSVNISSEGMEQYNQQADFLNQHIVLSSHYYDTKFSYDLNHALEKKFIEGEGSEQSRSLTMEEWANCLISTFAKTYDEIMTGYESGTRELYVPDENEECGYRKLTLEDELDMLHKEMNHQVDLLDRGNELQKTNREIDIEEDYLLQMHKYHRIVKNPEDKFEDKYFERLKEKVYNAVNGFLQGYQAGTDINELLSHITIKRENPEEDEDADRESQEV